MSLSDVGMPSLLAAALLQAAFLLSGCERNAPTKADPPRGVASTGASVSAAPAPAAVAFESVDARSITARGVPGGTEGRFIARPAVVASPCGFHLVVGGQNASWTTLLVGHELRWTKEGTPLLLQLDGLTLDVGLVDAKAMGSLGAPAPEALLQLAGQWETAWLSREAGGNLAIKDNANGKALGAPHPTWRVWSSTLGAGKTTADVPATNVVVATVALDERVLVLRALLDGEKLALRALRRLVFAVDSIELHPGALGKKTYVEGLQKAVRDDPSCSAIHAAHDAQLE